MLSNMAAGRSCHVAAQIMQHASSQGHAENRQLKACNSKAVFEHLTFNQTATAEFEMIQLQGVGSSHASCQSPADYQDIPTSGLLEQQAIEACLGRRRLNLCCLLPGDSNFTLIPRQHSLLHSVHCTHVSKLQRQSIEKSIVIVVSI